MKKFSKLMLGIVAGLMVFVSVPAMAKAAPSCPATETIVFNSTTETNRYTCVSIENLTKKSKITDVKSSNKAVVEFRRVCYHHSSYSTSYSDGTDAQDYKSYYAYIELTAKKAGTATLTYKVDGKKYTTKVVVKPYKNCLESLQVTGINSGKNIASKYKKSHEVYSRNSKAYSRIKIVAKAKSDCTIDRLYFCNQTNGQSLDLPTGGRRSATAYAPSVKGADWWFGYASVYDKNAGVYRDYYFLVNLL